MEAVAVICKSYCDNFCILFKHECNQSGFLLYNLHYEMLKSTSDNVSVMIGK